MAVPVAVLTADTLTPETALPNDYPFDGLASTVGDGVAITAWNFQLLDLPFGSGAVLVPDGAGGCTLQGADLWGNFRVFLVVTNNIGQTSETNPLLAPDSAFWHLRVEGAETGLQKLAYGERNHKEPLNAWATSIEQQRIDFIAHRIQDHDTTATGAQLTTLTNGGSGHLLHYHDGVDVDAATVGFPGVVFLGEAPVDVLNPHVPTKRVGEWCSYIPGTAIEKAEAGAPSWGYPPFLPNREVLLTRFTAMLMDSGAAGLTTVKFYDMTPAQWNANDFAGANLIAVVAIGHDSNAPASGTWGGAPLPYTLISGNLLVPKVARAPDNTDAGADLQIMVTWEERF